MKIELSDWELGEVFTTLKAALENAPPHAASDPRWITRMGDLLDKVGSAYWDMGGGDDDGNYDRGYGHSDDREDFHADG